mmetsp:Transcript_41222/g.128716  ORF Transcript_41222/g.128716 Transcript_41222/m.128716 type:complete len:290 (-) Transcript_41222:6-875(-)
MLGRLRLGRAARGRGRRCAWRRWRRCAAGGGADLPWPGGAGAAGAGRPAQACGGGRGWAVALAAGREGGRAAACGRLRGAPELRPRGGAARRRLRGVRASAPADGDGRRRAGAAPGGPAAGAAAGRRRGAAADAGGCGGLCGPVRNARAVVVRVAVPGQGRVLRCLRRRRRRRRQDAAGDGRHARRRGGVRGGGAGQHRHPRDAPAEGIRPRGDPRALPCPGGARHRDHRPERDGGQRCSDCDVRVAALPRRDGVCRMRRRTASRRAAAAEHVTEVEGTHACGAEQSVT